MAQKTINLLVFRADRQLWDGDSTDFLMTDLSHSPINIVKAKQLQPQSNNVPVEFDDLPLEHDRLYGLSLDATDHRITYQLINHDSFDRIGGVESDRAIVKMMLVPDHPTSSDIAGGYGKLRNNGSPIAADNTGLTQQQYDELDPLAKKMALLNLEAKLRDTNVNGTSLLSFVEGVRFVAVDRIFLFVREELKQMIDHSPDFKKANGHSAPTPDEAPPELNLPAHKDSCKHTRWDAGNIQLSFSQVAESVNGRQVFSLEADIDLDKGVGHVLEFLDNKIHKGKKTDQTLVYSLLFPQGITPYYTLNPLLG